MKKLITCFFALAIIAPAAIAADGGFSRALPSGKTGDNDAHTSTSRGAPAAARTAIRRDGSENSPTPARTATVSRVVNVVASDNAASVRDGTSPARSGVSARATGAAGANGARSNLDAAVSTVGRNARVNAASANANPAVRRAGITLRPSTAEVGGRATIGGTNIQTGSNVNDEIRNVTARASSSDRVVTAETIAAAKERLEQTADLNKSCQEQYNDCMDQFCAVIDANQKRCSCSSNLSRYTKVEDAVKDANTQLNEVAQRIRYVGLSADEIRAIMTATEAEEALSGQSDTTETRNMLQEIEDMIKDPVSTTSYSADTYSGFDMDFDFSSEMSDIFSLDFLNTNTTASFSNLRGSELYNAAKKRCATVLNQCKDAGATSQQITGNYDLAIDKDCIAYEQGLTKMNETLVSNVRSANRMLQKARLAVLQNKNQYDAKGCIAALNTCMTDEMVCGEGYTKCLDPTKRYIDENGKVVLGQNITDITSFMEDYDNSTIDTQFLQTAYNMPSVSADTCMADGSNDGRCVVKYLMGKIGTKQKVTDEGLCRAVLDKCQRYTYDTNNNYKPYNDVVLNYIQRAMVNIKSAQQTIISDYASSCMVDVAACYNQQVTQVNTWSSSASASSIQAVMRGACRNVALTCGFAIFDGPPEVYPDAKLPAAHCTQAVSCEDDEACKNSAYIDCVSEMFYQSLLCPDNSTYTSTSSDANKIKNGCGDNGETTPCYVNTQCICKDGYTVWGGACVLKCGAGETRNSYGACQKSSN